MVKRDEDLSDQGKEATGFSTGQQLNDVKGGGVSVKTDDGRFFEGIVVVIYLLFISFLLSACKMNNNKKVKKTLQWGSSTIKLYEVDEKTVPFEDRKSVV